MVVFELVDARIGDFDLRIVDDAGALIVGDIEFFGLEPETAPGERTETLAEDFVDRAAVIDFDSGEIAETV